MKKNTTKVILNQFMRGRNLMNLKDLKKNKTSTVILNQFMMKKNLMNVNIVTKDLMKKNIKSY